jgi:DNA-binding response OmpR family regulator
MTETGGILIVEADVLIRHPLAEYLRECGYQVAEALDLEEAKVLLASDALPIDIVLAAGPSGFAVANWLRGAHPNVEIILAGTVARATERAGELCAEGPAEHKPHDHKQVLEDIRRLMRARASRQAGK